ncbi:MAG: BrnT family toxin [Opitutales bacterium]|nr:BrnT family toxin [Opitutales bacterium]
MQFEFDPNKSKPNKEKHGIDFDEAQELWDDLEGAEIEARMDDEVRYALIGMIEDKRWTAVFTLRKDKIRIISVRRSRKKEIAIYESE